MHLAGTGLLAGLAMLLASAGAADAADEHTKKFIELNTAYMNRCAQGAKQASATTVFDAEGFEYCTLALDTEPLGRRARAVTFNNRGVLRLVRGDNAAAKTDFDAAIRVDRDFGEAYVSRAWAHVLAERFNEAVADANTAMAKGAGNAQAYYNRAAAYEGLGNAQRAYRDYTKASQLDPSWPRPKKDLARFTVTAR